MLDLSPDDVVSAAQPRQNTIYNVLNKQMNYLRIDYGTEENVLNKQMNYLRIDYGTEENTLFHCMNFRLQVTYDS